jgi:hypothetical protein
MTVLVACTIVLAESYSSPCKAQNSEKTLIVLKFSATNISIVRNTMIKFWCDLVPSRNLLDVSRLINFCLGVFCT